MFTKIDAFGTSEESRIFFVTRTTMRWATRATAKATAMTTPLLTSVSSPLMISCSIGLP